MNNKDLCSTSVLAPMTFPLKNGSEYILGVEKIKLYIDTYPNVDVIAELKKCRMWNIDNPSKRKTARGISKCINGWLSRVDKTTIGTVMLVDGPAKRDWMNEYE